MRSNWSVQIHDFQDSSESQQMDENSSTSDVPQSSKGLKFFPLAVHTGLISMGSVAQNDWKALIAHVTSKFLRKAAQTGKVKCQAKRMKAEKVFQDMMFD